ncbi:hypothetical protein HBB16_00420 [Pseudonocardia sp. MCCB 268]|nr:hypothetical protein [Pseudonocardia cytotoxica]
MAAALALAFGANMASPLYPGYQERLGFDDLTLTLIYAVYAAVSVPGAARARPAGDRIGRVRMVRASASPSRRSDRCASRSGTPRRGSSSAGYCRASRWARATGRAWRCWPARRPAPAGAGWYGRGALAFLVGTAAGLSLTAARPADLVPARTRPRTSCTPGSSPPCTPGSGRCRGRGFSVALRGGRPTAVPQPPTHDRGPFLAAMANGFVSWAVVGLFLRAGPERADPRLR